VAVAQELSGKKKAYELCPACWVTHHSACNPDEFADKVWDVIHKHAGEVEEGEILQQELEDRIKGLTIDIQEREGDIDSLSAEIDRLNAEVVDLQNKLYACENDVDK